MSWLQVVVKACSFFFFFFFFCPNTCRDRCLVGYMVISGDIDKTQREPMTCIHFMYKYNSIYYLDTKERAYTIVLSLD
ncbi:hypothetical protein BC941DRAFT_124019 [Chlamydoabsidia padenii]|nr:hypothetical protein BC941DRAFT_124019 [Chlamydoabsidia padenii]